MVSYLWHGNDVADPYAHRILVRIESGIHCRHDIARGHQNRIVVLLTTTALVPARTHRRASESGMSNGTLAKTTRSIFGALPARASAIGRRKSATEALA